MSEKHSSQTNGQSGNVVERERERERERDASDLRPIRNWERNIGRGEGESFARRKLVFSESRVSWLRFYLRSKRATHSAMFFIIFLRKRCHLVISELGLFSAVNG